MGVYISAKTRVDQSVSVQERILANVEGYVRRYDILGERREGGFLKTRIKALVLYKKVGDDLKQLGLTKPPPPPGNPRIDVQVSGAAAQGVRAALLAKGFQVMAGGTNGDISVRGETQTHPVEDPRLGGMRSARARVALEAVNPATGKVLGGAAAEAAGLDSTDAAASDKALAAAGGQAGADLAQSLASLLKAQTVVALRVDGLKGLDQVQRIIDDIRLNSGVSGAALSSFSDGRADIEVTTEKITGQDLAAMILQSRQLGLKARSVAPLAVELEAR